MKKLLCAVLVLIMVMCAVPAMAARLNVSGICFKYLQTLGADPSTSVTVKGNVSAGTIEQAILAGGAYGINYKLSHKGSGQAEYDARIEMSAPDGWTYTYTSKLKFGRSTGYVWYECLGTEFFVAYYSQFGVIESGTYTVRLYLDGSLEDTSTFRVN